MKNLQLLTPLLVKGIKISGLASLTILITSFLHQPSYGGGRSFYCAKLNGVPITFARNRYGKKIPIIYWNKGQFPPPWTALQRCKIVSWRFQRNFDNGTLKYLKTGILRRQPVVCGVIRRDDSCTSNTLLFTLSPDSNPKRVLLSLLNRHRSQTASIRRFRGVRKDNFRRSPQRPRTNEQLTGQSGAASDSSSNTQGIVTRNKRPNRDGVYVEQDNVYVDIDTYLK